VEMRRIFEWVRQLPARIRFNRRFARHAGVLAVGGEALELRRYRLRGSTTYLELCWRVAWKDVTKIVGFKVDCLACDIICLELELDGSSAVGVNEEMEGWPMLLEALPTRFGLRQEEWFTKVALPAFATNMTTLWPRQPASR